MLKLLLLLFLNVGGERISSYFIWILLFLTKVWFKAHNLFPPLNKVLGSTWDIPIIVVFYLWVQLWITSGTSFHTCLNYSRPRVFCSPCLGNILWLEEGLSQKTPEGEGKLLFFPLVDNSGYSESFRGFIPANPCISSGFAPGGAGQVLQALYGIENSLSRWKLSCRCWKRCDKSQFLNWN